MNFGDENIKFYTPILTGCRILAGEMPFPATNRILNFIFLQKFLLFCPFLTFFFSESKSGQMSQNFIRWFYRVKRTFRPNFGWPNLISGHQFYFEFWSILENLFFFSKTVSRQTFLIFHEVAQLHFFVQKFKV